MSVLGKLMESELSVFSMDSTILDLETGVDLGVAKGLLPLHPQVLLSVR